MHRLWKISTLHVLNMLVDPVVSSYPTVWLCSYMNDFRLFQRRVMDKYHAHTNLQGHTHSDQNNMLENGDHRLDSREHFGLRKHAFTNPGMGKACALFV